MLETFPGSRLVTSIYTPEQTFPEFGDHDVTQLVRRPPGLVRKDPRFALPIMARVFGRAEIPDADVLLCSSSGWAHGIRSDVPKIVYCHTPARWLYEPDVYALGHSSLARIGLRTVGLGFRRWDARAAASAHAYLANSTVVADRIRRAYGRTARVLHPPLMLDPHGERRDVRVPAPDFLLTIGRARGYKNTREVVAAARLLGRALVVVAAGGDGTEPGVVHLAGIDDESLRWLYANCRALVAAAYEDFGLTPIEAMAFGKPVVALRSGGYLDSVTEGRTGLFFDRASGASIASAIEALDTVSFDADHIRRHAAGFSLERFSKALTRIVDETLEGTTARS